MLARVAPSPAGAPTAAWIEAFTAWCSGRFRGAVVWARSLREPVGERAEARWSRLGLRLTPITPRVIPRWAGSAKLNEQAMAQDLSVVVDDWPGDLVSVGEATPRAGARACRWVDDLETAPVAL